MSKKPMKISKEVFDSLYAMLEKERLKADYNVVLNKNQIKRLVEEQVFLKRKRMVIIELIRAMRKYVPKEVK